MNVWVVGCNGMLGAAMVRRLQKRRIAYSGTTQLQLDVRDAKAIGLHVAAGDFTHVINCTGYTNVDGAEDRPKLAMQVNHHGVRNLAVAALQYSATFVHVSTDYVFDGTASQPYDETSGVNPRGVYAKSKRAGEEAVLEIFADAVISTRFYIVRTSWLFGPDGYDNFVKTMARLLRQHREIAVVADQCSRPTYAPDLALGILALTGLAVSKVPAASGIYHFANAGHTTWHAFTGAIQQRMKRREPELDPVALRPITTKAFGAAAPRPSYSVLATHKFSSATGIQPRPWGEALDDYVSLLCGR